MSVEKTISRCSDQEEIVLRCLEVFVKAGTLDVSLDHIAGNVGVSKRMLIHYFGCREVLEECAMDLFELRLRAQFSPDSFPPEASLQMVLSELWKRTTEATSRGALLLVMELSRRAWNGSSRAQKFYKEQQRLWVELLMNYLPEKETVEDVLQSFQGAVLAYLVTGDSHRGQRMINSISKRL